MVRSITMFGGGMQQNEREFADVWIVMSRMPYEILLVVQYDAYVLLYVGESYQPVTQ